MKVSAKAARVAALLGVASAVAIAPVVLAQTPNRGWQELEKKLIGWGPIMPPMGNATPAKARQNINYTAARKQQIDLFASWIRKTYTPFGVLAQPEINIVPDKASSTYSVPVTSGISMRLWAPAYAGNTSKITRAQPASAADIGIYSSSLPGVEPAWWFNTPTRYYFTMTTDRDGKLIDPIYEEKYAPVVSEVRSKIGLTEGNCVIYVTGGTYITILLLPSGRLPVEPVSCGEALQVAEAGVKKANQQDKNPPERLKVQLGVIQKMRGKYRDSLNEPAQIRGLQFGIYTFDTTYDVFEDRVLYPLYKFSPATYAKAKTNQPPWITIQFPIANQPDAKEKNKRIYQAMTEKFNYQYVYDYYFNPQKVKGKPYQTRK
jgi:hypothetical protein